MTENDAIKKLYLEDLKKYAIRGIENINPGDRLLYGHVPELVDPSIENYEQAIFGYELEVVDIVFKNESALILYTNKDGNSESYASDSGVVPYGVSATSEGFYNSTNFMVDPAKLEAEGFQIELEPSEGYLEKLNEYNSKIAENEPHWDDPDYYEDSWNELAYDEYSHLENPGLSEYHAGSDPLDNDLESEGK